MDLRPTSRARKVHAASEPSSRGLGAAGRPTPLPSGKLHAPLNALRADLDVNSDDAPSVEDGFASPTSIGNGDDGFVLGDCSHNHLLQSFEEDRQLGCHMA